jgi:hypothetical protein
VDSGPSRQPSSKTSPPTTFPLGAPFKAAVHRLYRLAHLDVLVCDKFRSFLFDYPSDYGIFTREF